MARRRHAREVALQMLYQKDLNRDIDADTVRALIEEQIRNPSLREFAWSLFDGVIGRQIELDAQIELTAENWSLSRMAPTDRNVLRLSAFELLFTETPSPVVIDEAVDLAKRFGTRESPQFVNGILDRLIPESKKAGPTDAGDATK